MAAGQRAQARRIDEVVGRLPSPELSHLMPESQLTDEVERITQRMRVRLREGPGGGCCLQPL